MDIITSPPTSDQSQTYWSASQLSNLDFLTTIYPILFWIPSSETPDQQPVCQVIVPDIQLTRYTNLATQALQFLKSLPQTDNFNPNNLPDTIEKEEENKEKSFFNVLPFFEKKYLQQYIRSLIPLELKQKDDQTSPKITAEKLRESLKDLNRVFTLAANNCRLDILQIIHQETDQKIKMKYYFNWSLALNTMMLHEGFTRMMKREIEKGSYDKIEILLEILYNKQCFRIHSWWKPAGELLAAYVGKYEQAATKLLHGDYILDKNILIHAVYILSPSNTNNGSGRFSCLLREALKPPHNIQDECLLGAFAYNTSARKIVEEHILKTEDISPQVCSSILITAIEENNSNLVDRLINKTAFQNIPNKYLSNILAQAINKEEIGDILINDDNLDKLTQQQLLDCLFKAIHVYNLEVIKKIIPKITKPVTTANIGLALNVFKETVEHILTCQAQKDASPQLNHNLQILQEILQIFKSEEAQDNHHNSLIDALHQAHENRDNFENLKKVIDLMSANLSWESNTIYDQLLQKEVDSWEEDAWFANNVGLSILTNNPIISISGAPLGNALTKASYISKRAVVGAVCNNRNFHKIPLLSLWKAMLAGNKGCLQLVLRTLFSRNFWMFIPPLVLIPIFGLIRNSIRYAISYT